MNGPWQARKKGEAAWRPVLVPGAYDFEGEVEFKREFSLDSSLVGQGLTLQVLGVNNRCTLFINDEFLGSHEGGHTPFSFDIRPDLVIFGRKNEIRIKVDNTLKPRQGLPLKHRPRLGHNYGGLFRDIFIVVKPAVFIDALQVRTTFTDAYKTAQLLVNVSIKLKTDIMSARAKHNLRLHVDLLQGEGGRLVARLPAQSIDSGTNEFLFTVPDAALWSPENPQLYWVNAYLVQGRQLVDEISSKVGICEIIARGEKIRLNGQALQVKGVDWYEDFPDSGPTAGQPELQAEMLKVKQLGANAVRVVGFPPDPFLLDVCDSLGLLVFLEPPLFLVPDKFFSNASFDHSVLHYYQEMLAAYADHVSVAAWGLGFELQAGLPSTRKQTQALKRIIRDYSARPTYLVVRSPEWLQGTQLADLLVLDFYNQASNQIPGLTHSWQARHPGVPLVISYGYPLISPSGALADFGAEERAGVAAGENGQENQLRLQQVQASKTQEAGFALAQEARAAGYFLHTLNDWTQARPDVIFGPSRKPYLSRSGLIAHDGRNRIVYGLVQSQFQGEPPASLASRSSDFVNPVAYPISGLALILLFLFNFNRNRRFRNSLHRAFVYPHGFFTDIKDKRKVSAWHALFLGLVTLALTSLIGSSIAFLLRTSLLFDEVLNLLIGTDSFKNELIWLIWHPPAFVAFFTGLSFVIVGLLVLLLKVTAFLVGQDLTLKQLLAQVFWSAANLVWLLPIVPIYYRIISKPEWFAPALYLLLLFGLWLVIRLFRGVKVVYSLSFVKTTVVAFIFCLVVLGGLGWYYDRSVALFDYLPYYMKLVI